MLGFPNYFSQILSQMFVEREVLISHHSPHNFMIYKMLTSYVLYTFGKEFGKFFGNLALLIYNTH